MYSRRHKRLPPRSPWGKRIGDIWERAVARKLEQLGFKTNYSDIHGADIKAWRGKYVIYVECKFRTYPTSFYVTRGNLLRLVKHNGILAFLYMGTPYYVSAKRLLEYLDKWGKWRIPSFVPDEVIEEAKKAGMDYEDLLNASVSRGDLELVATHDLKEVIEEVLNRKLDWVSESSSKE